MGGAADSTRRRAGARLTRPKPESGAAVEVCAFPKSLDAERAILGAALQWPEKVFPVVGDLVGCFYRRDHEELWALLLAMRAEGAPVDLVTVPDRVGRSNTPGRFGGVAYVAELPNHAPAWANAGYYAGLVRADARRRKVIAACHEAADRAYRGTDPVDEVVDDLVARLVEVCE